jgi:hypothetical protein
MRSKRSKVGITTNLYSRRKQWGASLPIIWEWMEFGPFETKEAAEKWEASQLGSENVSVRESTSDRKAVNWHGYKFYY